MPGSVQRITHGADDLRARLGGGSAAGPLVQRAGVGWSSRSSLRRMYTGEALLAVAEMIRGGTVAFADHYFYMDRVGEAVEQAGPRALLAWCVFGEQNNIGTDLADTVDFRAALARARRTAGFARCSGPALALRMCEPRF